MTEDEREKLIEEIKFTMCAGFVRGFHYRYIAEKALAIAERRIREDCAEIAKGFEHNRDWVKGSLYGKIRQEVAALIAASIPEPKEPQ